jgi:uncharacterized protein YxjI
MAPNQSITGAIVYATIKEHKFSLRSEYDIASPSETFVAQKALLSLLAKVEIRNPSDMVVATIHGNFSLFYANYDFALADGRNFHYACEKLWKGVYSCIGADGSYHLFRHKGVRYSIFKENAQTAAVARNKLIVGTGHEYDILMNADADLVVISCMILALNTSDDDGSEQNAFTYDFGNIGPEDRQFDESWQPT